MDLLYLLTGTAYTGATGEAEARWETCLSQKLVPTEVHVSSETYSRNLDRSADYVLSAGSMVNRKAKIELTWDLIKCSNVTTLMQNLNYAYDFVDPLTEEVVPKDLQTYKIEYKDFTGTREAIMYLGQTIEADQTEYLLTESGTTQAVQFWKSFRLAFIEV